MRSHLKLNDLLGFSRNAGATVPVGSVIGSAYVDSGVSVASTTVLPIDDTIPQITEGTEVLSVFYNPLYPTSIIEMEYCVFITESVNQLDTVAAAAFRSDQSDALHVSYQNSVGAGSSLTNAFLSGLVRVTANTTNTVTWSVRFGGSAASSDIGANRQVGSNTRAFGTVPKSVLIVREIFQG